MLGKCSYCKKIAPIVDHHDEVPACFGGQHTEPICYACNSIKHKLKNMDTGYLSKKKREELILQQGLAMRGQKYGMDIIDGKYVVNNQEQDIINLIKEFYKSMTKQQICDCLNEQKILKRGKLWTVSNISSII